MTLDVKKRPLKRFLKMNGKINTAKSMGLIWIKFSYNMFSIIFSLKGVLMHYEGIEIFKN